MTREPVIWNQREEVDWLNYSVQPPKGLLIGDYYKAVNEFGAPAGMQGHTGSLEVVCSGGKLLFVEFNEKTMPDYYNQYFGGIDKRRTDYGIWQASKPRQAKAGVVLADGMAFVEAQMMEKQSLEGNFELLTGASGSMRNLLPLASKLSKEIQTSSKQKLYSLSEDFGYGLTGWLRIVIEDGKIVDLRYDEIFADHQKPIRYPELKRYYKQSKYFSPCYQDPFAPGWDRHCWNCSFRAIMDLLRARVLEKQDLFDIEGLIYTDGENMGPLWDHDAPFDAPQTNSVQVRYPSYDNYLHMASELAKHLPAPFGR